jgi:2'-5' RNA ligase
MRLFVAIVPPSSVRDRLAASREALRQSGADVKWVEAENLHITLKFLGNVEGARIDAVREALAGVASAHRRFSLQFLGTGVFPNRRRPRVVWVGTAESAALVRLQADVEAALEELGFAAEARGFTAHLTLGRARSDKNVKPLVERLDRLQGEDYGAMTVDVVSLMESQLSSRGPTYRHLNDLPLAI